MKKKTSKSYWKSYYEKQKLPILINRKLIIYNRAHKLFSRYIKKNIKGSIIEIGCSPGSWLIYFNREFNLNVYGIEYIKEKCKLTEKNLCLCKVKGKIYCGDFFKNKIGEKFDYVFSWGFIEHFDPLDQVIEKQKELLKKKGLLIAVIPNTKGFNLMMAKIFSKSTIFKHNQKIMKPLALKEAFANNNLSVIEAGYFGKLNLTMINWGFFQKKPFIYAIHAINQVLSRIWPSESSFFSPYLYIICKKK